MVRRRDFLRSAGAAIAASALQAQVEPPGRGLWRTGEVIGERQAQRKGIHNGKVLAAIQPHADDIPLFAGGTVAKLIDEGYTGYMIRTTNDEKAGPGTMGETVLGNEKDTEAVARVLGLKKVFHLNYRNHRLDDASRQDLRGRLIFLFRLLKVNTVICYDPWGTYEENPDHYVTAQQVEAACWMANGTKDYPEHFEAGLKPHAVTEKYYFARGPQLVNRVVDITSHIDRKIESNLVNVSQGPGGHNGSRLRQALDKRNLTLPILGKDDATADREYIRHIVLDADSQVQRGVPSDKVAGKAFGFEWAEPFHYIGPPQSRIEKYISEHGVPAR
jgi:LmbE family N-acetylglucosaminyl deacetylase